MAIPMPTTYINNTTRSTTTPGIRPNLSTFQFYNRTLLREMEPKLVHLQFGDEYKMPLNNGMTMNFRKLVPLDAKTTALTEGDPGDGVLLAETEVTCTLAQYGAYGVFTDLFDFANLDIGLAEKSEQFGQQGGLSIDRVVSNVLASSTNVIYANGKASRAALTRTDKLTSAEIRKAVRTLKKAKAETFGGYYVAIVGPDTIYDLQDDDAFVKVSEYQDKENIYTGEVGRLWGVRFIETTEAKIFAEAGASSIDVASINVLGRHAYGYTSWKGAHPQMVIKGRGSAGTADPLDQISTVGWKMDGFGCAMLQPEYLVRIECGFSA